MAHPMTNAPSVQGALPEHETFLRGRLRGLGVPPHRLDDAVQDVFEVVVRRMDEYDARYSLRGWMAGVARKVARRHREHDGRAPLSLVVDVEAKASDPERTAMTEEAYERLETFLEGLTRPQWEAFVLAEIEGLRGTEIASELDVNLSTVYARLRSARAQLARTVGEEERRRWLPAWVPLLGGARPTASAPVVLGSVAIVATLALAALAAGSTRGCASDETRPMVSAERAAVAPAAAAGGGVGARPTDPAGLAGAKVASDTPALPSTPRGSDDGWTPSTSGSHGEADGTLSWEIHHRFDGDTVEHRITLIGDDDIAMPREYVDITTDGLEILHPLPERLEVAPGEERVVITKLRASRDGVVRWRYVSRAHDGPGSTSPRRLAYVLDDGALRPCRNDECATTGEPAVAGDDKSVLIRNDCRLPVRFAYMDTFGTPPRGTPIQTFAPGQSEIVSMSAAAQVVMVDDGGKARVGLSTDSAEGGLIAFTNVDGSEQCGGRVVDAGAR